MKKEFIIINGITFVAVVILFIVVFSNKSQSSEIQEHDGVELLVPPVGIVYVNTDSLILNYEYAQFLSEELLLKEESSRADFNEKARIFQNEMREFQRKVQNQSFISLESAEKQQHNLMQKERDLQDLNDRLSNELLEEQMRMNMELRDTLSIFLKEYCKDKPYSIVLSNSMGDNILYSIDGLDITEEVVNLLNSRYLASKKK
ncbi:MAG: OmpH family outer membrane protein [Marinilabiliaceae bacterium]|nr:OmpH family outer membrane protein [Marinilabiliaceae bacterium]